MSYTMENGDSLYARIAELEKENEKLKEEMENWLLSNGWKRKDDDTDDEDEEDPDRCVKCDRTFDQRKLLNDYDCAKAWELHCDMGDDEGDLCGACLQKWEDDNEEEIREHKEKAEVLEDLTCDQLRDRLRAMNKPVSGKMTKAVLIHVIRQHEIREHKRDNEDTDDEDEEEEEEVLEDLTCAQLKQRLRAINKPVGGRKAELIQRIRDHERLTAALFEED
mgnify:FL=1